MTDVLFALGLTMFAGMATGIGSVIAFTAKRANYRFLSISTGFSAGVMLYVSFVEIFHKGASALAESYGDTWGHWINAGSFFGGILVIALIDNFIPPPRTPMKRIQKRRSLRCTVQQRRSPPPERQGTRSGRNTTNVTATRGTTKS